MMILPGCIIITLIRPTLRNKRNFLEKTPKLVLKRREKTIGVVTSQ